MNFKDIAANMAAQLPKVDIGGYTFHVRPWQPLSIESASHIAKASAIARALHSPSDDDGEAFSEDKPAAMNGFELLCDEQGYYTCKTKGEARIAKSAAVTRSVLVPVSCLVDDKGKRPWWDDNDVSDLIELCRAVEMNAEVSNEISELSGSRKLFLQAIKKAEEAKSKGEPTPEESAGTDEGN